MTRADEPFTVVHETDLDVPPAQVWATLVAPGGRRDWYYQLEPEGEWLPGGRLRWRGPDGSIAEESTVEALEPPRRLDLSTRFLFAPQFAEEPPHRIAWEIEPSETGCRVRMTARFAAHTGAARMYENEGAGILKGLRLALDPEARRGLARVDTLGEVEVADVTPARLADYLRFFDEDAFRDNPSWQGCYCMEPHWDGSQEDWATRTAADNRAEMSRLIEAGQVTALLAYAGGRPVGWCNYGETTRLQGLLHRYGLQGADLEGVGSIACFVIPVQYRRHGVASRLLEAACDRLRSRGLRWAEAYPPAGAASDRSSYRGPLDMYLRAGFERHRESGRSFVVRRRL